MNKEKILQLLGLATRARKVVTGEELVIKEIQKGNAKLVILSSDASQNSRKKFKINVRITTLNSIRSAIVMSWDMRLAKKNG